mmetsp:Transcript_67017/g.111381  ORF Transcript_67017/g.111381 Transcript_67017/m.111381 type:complete len:346 (-) Transcript_67017:3-1040(-)
MAVTLSRWLPRLHLKLENARRPIRCIWSAALPLFKSASVEWVYHPDYAVLDGWEPSHRFNMHKYPRLYELLTEKKIVNPAALHLPSDPADNLLHLAHCPAYVAAYCSGSLCASAQRRIGLPWSSSMVHAVRLEVAGTILAARLALRAGLACNLGGGTHHAHWAAGAGFNAFNDLAVTAKTLLQERTVRHILVVDLDVHQGDGTAAILANEPRATTFSMHASRAFPIRKQVSSLDVGLATGTRGMEYMRLLRAHLPALLDGPCTPDLVLYDAGVDVHEHDMVREFCRGHLSLTDDDIWERDSYVYHSCLSRRIPVATVIGGGYSRNVDELARRHAIHAEAAAMMIA